VLQYATDDEVKKALREQLNHPVLREDCMRKLLQDRVQLFVKVRPGKVLQGLMRRIDRKQKYSNQSVISNVLD